MSQSSNSGPVSAALPTDSVQNPSLALASSGPPPMEIQSYFSIVRTRLSNALHFHEARGAAPTSVILRISVLKSGKIASQEIEKSSGNPELDKSVLEAFLSILPLPAFPVSWERDGHSPEALTVRLPIKIEAKH